MTRYYWARLDRPLSSFNADDELNPYLKEAQCKRYDPRTLLSRYTPETPVRGVPDVAALASNADAAHATASREADIAKIVDAADALGRWVQLDCAGFLTNKRQHRQFGLAVIPELRVFSPFKSKYPATPCQILNFQNNFIFVWNFTRKLTNATIWNSR